MSDQPPGPAGTFELCPACAARMEQARAAGMLGIAISGDCGERGRAFDAEAQRLAAASQPAHPPPWRWDRYSDCSEVLYDAHGKMLIGKPINDRSLGDVRVASERVRALTESASEAAVSLRWALGAIDQFLAQEGHWPAERGTDEADEKALAEAKALLAHIDERSRG
jgi:hypothetical protein